MWRGLAAKGLVGVLALGGCGARSTGVVEAADGMLSLTASGPDLAAATERALRDATAHCAGQGRQTQILGTQMGRDEYRLAFRCTGRAVAAPVPPPSAPATPSMVMLSPGEAPMLYGPPFGRGTAPPPLPPLPPPRALPPPAVAAPALILLQPGAGPVLSGDGLGGRTAPATPAPPPVAAVQPAPARSSSPLPPLSSGASLPPLYGPVGLRRD
jgi:hypothetical protein